MTREAVVAGQFYPGTKKGLVSDLDRLIQTKTLQIDAMGALSPHAGYVYSGMIAGELYGALQPKDLYVILGPNHTGNGTQFALSTEPWRTPLGEVGVDLDLAGRLCQKTGLLKEDASAHAREHSIEVQLPFIQRISPGARIVPITVKHGSLSDLKELGRAIAASLEEKKERTLIIASSDMTHYETRSVAAGKDRLAIDRILALDPDGLYSSVEKEDISMCGYIPAVIMLASVKQNGAKNAKLVRYTDSGEATGNISEVVGYAGIAIY